jgi:hypothetical protein
VADDGHPDNPTLRIDLVDDPVRPSSGNQVTLELEMERLSETKGVTGNGVKAIDDRPNRLLG